MIPYEYASGALIKTFDLILSTTPECKYPTYSYTLSVVSPLTETVSSLGISVDNSKTPAELIIDQPIISVSKLVTL